MEGRIRKQTDPWGCTVRRLQFADCTAKSRPRASAAVVIAGPYRGPLRWNSMGAEISFSASWIVKRVLVKVSVAGRHRDRLRDRERERERN